MTVFKLLPKFGPFKPLAFQPLTPPTERMFLDSFERARAQYREWLTAAQRGRLALRDSDLDTGAAPLPGVNPLADETYDELLARVAKGKVVAVTPALRKAINDHYSSRREGPRAEQRSRREEKKIAAYLAALNALDPRDGATKSLTRSARMTQRTTLLIVFVLFVKARRAFVVFGAAIMFAMTRFLHVANGTSTTTTIEAAGIPGVRSIWADPLHEGPVPGGVIDDELVGVRTQYLGGITTPIPTR